MFAGAVFLQHPGHDRLLSAELRGAEYHRAALQELRTMVSADRAGQRGILRAACSGRITDQQFYDWSERARAEKDKCEQGLISQKELEVWLKESK